MPDIVILKQQARAKATELGHELELWNKTKRVWTNTCKHCKAEIRIHRSVHFGFNKIKGPASDEKCYYSATK